ncbi:hypothetical protein GCM10010411_01550 [Actinomadura fulvescens]|uniref:Uncharacterized protein n=1 Tax=Actinomadura fulvescens TaxID=46160 RepID=A0ABN3PCX4_9ACTN
MSYAALRSNPSLPQRGLNGRPYPAAEWGDGRKSCSAPDRANHGDPAASAQQPPETTEQIMNDTFAAPADDQDEAARALQTALDRRDNGGQSGR